MPWKGIYQTSPWGQFFDRQPCPGEDVGATIHRKMLYRQLDTQLMKYGQTRINAVIIYGCSNRTVLSLIMNASFYRKDKTGYGFSLNSSRVVGPDGEMLNYSGFIEDISERRWVQQALAKSRAQILAVFDSTNDLIWSVDPVNFGVVTWNSALADYFSEKLGIELRVGMPPEQLCHPSSSPPGGNSTRGLCGRVLSPRKYCAASGTTILLISFNLLKHDGEVFGISIFGKDVTEPKKAEEALKGARKRYRALVETSSDWVWEVDGKCQLHLCRSQNRKILGYGTEEIIGAPLFS